MGSDDGTVVGVLDGTLVGVSVGSDDGIRRLVRWSAPLSADGSDEAVLVGTLVDGDRRGHAQMGTVVGVLVRRTRGRLPWAATTALSVGVLDGTLVGVSVGSDDGYRRWCAGRHPCRQMAAMKACSWAHS